MNDSDTYVHLLSSLRADFSRYHDHKESSAWVATAVYLGASAAVVYFRELPLSVSAGADAIVAAGIVWFFFVLGAVLVLWQLSKRTTAAIIVEATQRLLSANLFSQRVPPADELRPDSIRGGGTLPRVLCCEIRKVRESWPGSVGTAVVSIAVVVAGILDGMVLLRWALTLP